MLWCRRMVSRDALRRERDASIPSPFSLIPTPSLSFAVIVAQHLYIINELLPTVTHTLLSPSSPPRLVSKTSIVPPPPPPPSASLLNPLASPINKGTAASSAELLLVPTLPKRTILASTRTLNDRETDTLAMFELNEETGEITLKEFLFPRKGREFRAVGLSSCGNYIVVAGQVSSVFPFVSLRVELTRFVFGCALQEDGWVSVFGQDDKGKWVEVVEEQVKLEKATHVLFV